MSPYRDWDDFGKPIRTDKGIKASSQRGNFAQNWWATRWIRALEQLVDPGRLGRGRRYARQGQVLNIEQKGSTVAAQVQGSRPRPYKVKLTLAALTDAQWEKVMAALAEQAVFAAQLLAGEMPPEIEQVFQAAGVSLFPDRSEELKTECSCPDPDKPCKHIAAVHYILGERFDQDPFMLFRLRGRSQEQILAALRGRRLAGEPEEAGSPAEVEPVQPLGEEVNHFWEPAQPLGQFKTAIQPPQVEYPVLKRLGQPPFLQDDIVQLLGPAYQAITETAMTVMFEEKPTTAATAS